jgi:hypothetical protein
MADRSAARAMGENGRREVRVRLNWPHLAAQMLSAYAIAAAR